MVGAFYEHEIKSILWDLLTPGTMQQQLAENDGKSIVTTGANGLIFQEPSDQLFMEKAVFGEATWHLTGRWDLIAGARVFHQDFSEIQSYTSYTFFEGQSAASSTEGTNQTFKLNTSYKFADTQLAYATFSQGYRRGGANAVPTSGYLGESPEIEKYSPDKANNYEIGLKGRLDDGLRYSADVFYIQWKDAQIGLSTPVNGWPVVINSAGARSKGVELELSTPIIVPAASMTLGYTYVDATLTKSFCLPAGNGYGGFTPCGISGTAGNQLPGTPKNSASATFNYDQGLGANSRLIYALNASYKGSIYAQLPSIAGIDNNLAGYTLLNGSITFQPGNNIRLSLYGNNLADKRAYYTVPAHDADLLAYAQEFTISTPREIGIRVGYHW